MKKKMADNKKTKGKYVPSLSKEEEEKKRAIVEKRIRTINKNKRNAFIDMLYKKYE